MHYLCPGKSFRLLRQILLRFFCLLVSGRCPLSINNDIVKRLQQNLRKAFNDFRALYSDDEVYIVKMICEEGSFILKSQDVLGLQKSRMKKLAVNA